MKHCGKKRTLKSYNTVSPLMSFYLNVVVVVRLRHAELAVDSTSEMFPRPTYTEAMLWSI